MAAVAVSVKLTNACALAGALTEGAARHGSRQVVAAVAAAAFRTAWELLAVDAADLSPNADELLGRQTVAAAALQAHGDLVCLAGKPSHNLGTATVAAGTWLSKQEKRALQSLRRKRNSAEHHWEWAPSASATTTPCGSTGAAATGESHSETEAGTLAAAQAEADAAEDAAANAGAEGMVAAKTAEEARTEDEAKAAALAEAEAAEEPAAHARAEEEAAAQAARAEVEAAPSAAEEARTDHEAMVAEQAEAEAAVLAAADASAARLHALEERAQAIADARAEEVAAAKAEVAANRRLARSQKRAARKLADNTW